MEEPKVKRRLAAILAADIAGYSRLMGQDDAATVRDLKGHQDVVLPLVGAFGGRIIDIAGDGILAEFPSAVAAVECATEIQKVMAVRNQGQPEDRRMQFRVGINLGDVIHDETRIYGDGINVAARLENIAVPGGICISEDVYRQIRDKLDLPCRDLGEQALKNIARPVRVYALGPDTGAYDPTPSVTATPQVRGATRGGSRISTTVVQVLRNPARAALAMRTGGTDLVRPWPLVLALLSLGVLLQQVMPIPGNSILDMMQFERLPPVAEVFENEAIDRTRLRVNLSRLESALEPIGILLIALLTAAGLRVLDGTRGFFEYVDTFVYAVAATIICMLPLHLLFYFFHREGVAFGMFFAFVLYVYFLYAIWWLYWDRKALAVGQSTMFLVANALGQLVALFVIVPLAIAFVRLQYGEFIGAYGNRDIYIADLGVERREVSVLRPWNVTKSVAMHEKASFSPDGRRLFASVATSGNSSDLFVWDLGTGVGKQLTRTPGIKESDVVEFADGSRLVIRDFSLWRYAEGVEPEQLLPAGEDIRHLCVGPGRTAMIVSGADHRGFLFDLDSRKIRLVPGATKLGRRVQWHLELKRFSAIRFIEGISELVAIDPVSGEIQPLVRIPSSLAPPRDDGSHAWVAPDVAIWGHGSTITALGIDGSTWAVVDLAKHGIRGVSNVIVNNARSRIAFERARNVTWDQYRRSIWEKLTERGPEAKPIAPMHGKLLD